jgi:hypothetical protein
MQYTVLLAIVAAAAVNANDYASTTYGGAVLPPHKHYDCDATADKCYAPASYGNDYKPQGYSYERSFPYPGPKKRFCNKLKRFGLAIKGVFKKIFKGFKHTWARFAKKWNKWCAVKKSDWERFKHWKECKDAKFKKWWEYHHDLCKTRKQLWDDAMREFHRQWCHYKQHAKDEYEKRKKACGVHETDYDELPEYTNNLNKYGVTPVENHYKKHTTYDAKAYKAHCDTRDTAYKAKHKKDTNLGCSPGKLVDFPIPPTPVGGDAGPGTPAPVGGDVAPVTPTGPPAPVSG